MLDEAADFAFGFSPDWSDHLVLWGGAKEPFEIYVWAEALEKVDDKVGVILQSRKCKRIFPILALHGSAAHDMQVMQFQYIQALS